MRPSLAAAWCLWLCLSGPLALTGCGGGGTPAAATAPAARTPPSPFDGLAAWRLLRAQVAVGQRPAGSPQLRRLAERLRRRLPQGRFEAIPGEPGLRNVVATVRGSRPALLVGAHYDTLVKPKGFVGANNGAAGSAIVVELARLFAHRRRPPGAPELRFVLFDGEEPAAGLPEESADFYTHGLRGSRAYVAAHRGEIGAMVLLDYVAGRRLTLPREATSDAGLWARVRAAAGAAGHGALFPDRTDTAIEDDHTPFLRAGIPAVDMIDWTYPGHTLQDGLALVSQASVQAVGATLTRLLDGWRPAPGLRPSSR